MIETKIDLLKGTRKKVKKISIYLTIICYQKGIYSIFLRGNRVSPSEIDRSLAGVDQKQSWTWGEIFSVLLFETNAYKVVLGD